MGREYSRNPIFLKIIPFFFDNCTLSIMQWLLQYASEKHRNLFAWILREYVVFRRRCAKNGKCFVRCEKVRCMLVPYDDVRFECARARSADQSFWIWNPITAVNNGLIDYKAIFSFLRMTISLSRPLPTVYRIP